MTEPFNYSTTYKLDKSHFSETFDESITEENSKNLYLKSILLAVMGSSILLFTEINTYVAWFIVALAAVEALSVRFRKPWWLTRQMISKAANSELTLIIDEKRVSSKSYYVESKILWNDISKIEQTAQGWMLFHSAGKNYISGRCLSESANEFIKTQALTNSQ
jgi:hypothetical protein